MNSKVSIVDVAKKADVSITTVSRVVNNTGYPVSEEKRKKVLDAVKALNYVPNKSAQALRGKGSNGIALIVRNISDPYFAEIEKGVIECAMKNDKIAVVFNSMQDTQYEMKYYQMILKQQYDGLIIGGGAYGGTKANDRLKDIVDELKAQGTAVVALAPQGFQVPLVSVDNVEVGRKATEYLLKQGHRKIAYLGGYPDHLADTDRYKGYCKALEDAGLAVDEDLVIFSAYSEKAGFSCTEELFARKKELTAIYCSNDHIAYGAMDYMEKKGMRIPEDISIMGTGAFFSDSDELWYDRSLTSVHFPFSTLGERAVELIVGGNLDDALEEIHDVWIDEKKTVGPPGKP